MLCDDCGRHYDDWNEDHGYFCCYCNGQYHFACRPPEYAPVRGFGKYGPEMVSVEPLCPSCAAEEP